MLCPDDQPVTAKSVKEAIWGQLSLMLKSANATNVTYAIHQLDQMSGRKESFGATQDFDRTNVLNAIHGLMTDSNPQVAQAAIVAVGSHNPYMSDERTIFWLATVGSGEVPGIGKMDPKMINLGGELYWTGPLHAGGQQSSNETRAMAIQALGLVREPSLKPAVERWLADPAPAIRASATLLLADFPGPESCKRLAALADDAAPEVRACVARAAGFAQQVEAADTLAKLLADTEAKVRTAAAMSLLSFSPKDKVIADIFRANVENDEFKPLFLIALARENPAGYLDALASAVEQRTEPKNWWGGQIPAFTAWEILFRYLQTQPPEALQLRQAGPLSRRDGEGRQLLVFRAARHLRLLPPAWHDRARAEVSAQPRARPHPTTSTTTSSRWTRIHRSTGDSKCAHGGGRKRVTLETAVQPMGKARTCARCLPSCHKCAILVA